VRDERVWACAQGRVWERTAERAWLVDGPGGRAVFDLRLAQPVAPRPAPGAPLQREEPAPGTLVLRSGNTEWLRCEGLQGSEAVADLLALSAGLRDDVRAELQKLRGVPQLLVLRSAEGERVTTYTFGAPAAGELPAWALQTASWPAAPDALKAHPKVKKPRSDDE
jgi:hypothetical protein